MSPSSCVFAVVVAAAVTASSAFFNASLAAFTFVISAWTAAGVALSSAITASAAFLAASAAFLASSYAVTLLAGLSAVVGTLVISLANSLFAFVRAVLSAGFTTYGTVTFSVL